MTDDTGKVISSLDESILGEKSSIYHGIDKNKEFESFTVQDGSEKEQVIFYRLTDFNGILVNKVPLNTITKSAKTLLYGLLALFIVSILLVFLLSKFWVYKLLDPLKRLVEGIKKVGQGNLGLTIAGKP